MFKVTFIFNEVSKNDSVDGFYTAEALKWNDKSKRFVNMSFPLLPGDMCITSILAT